MKKFLSLVLALALLCACVPAFADYAYDGEAPVVMPVGSDYGSLDVTDPTGLYWNVPAYNGVDSCTVSIHKVRMQNDAIIETTELGNVAPDTAVTWPVEALVDPDMDDFEQKYVIEVLTNTGVTYYYNYYINWTKGGPVVLSYDAYYPNNHAHAFGPKVDGSWKTYAAIDLTVEGTQVYDLVAAGAYKIGTVSVTVAGDEVVVDYLMTEDIMTRDVHDDITVDSEYINFFADAASIDMSAESALKFGEPISIANDLGGDTTVCMYMELVVDYNVSSPFVTRFWPNMRENKAIVEAMNALLAE